MAERKKILLVEDNLKDKVLEELDKENKLVNIKILSKNEFITNYFYDYNEETIYYVVRYYNTNPKNAKIFLDNMKYVLEIDSQDEKILFLKKLYQELTEKKLLILNNYFKEYLKSVHIEVLLSEKIEPFFRNILDKYDVSYQSISKTNLDLTPNIYHFKDIDTECSYIFDSISSLIKKGVDIQNIKLINIGNEYTHHLKRFSKFYGLKINNLDRESIYGTLLVNKVLKLIKEGKSKDDILAYLNKKMNEELGLKIFNILNKYYFVDDFLEVLDLIKEDFKEAFIKPLNNKNALDLIPLNSFLIKDTDYVFLMGFNLENIPKTYKDIDYLSDDLKSKIGLFTSLEKNINERITTLYHLKNIKNLVITYKDSDAYQSYYPSNLISELGKSVDLFDSLNNTSNLYNKIKLTKKLDTFLKYGEEEDGTAILLNTYKDIPYLTYDNKYKRINKKIQNIRLSYTSLDNFYHCQFRFYIDSILKLNIYEDNFKLLIGNLFHYVLSKMYSEDFNLESTWNEFLESKKFSKKEEFYLEILKEELVEIIEILKQHYELTGLTNIKTESEINLEYPDNFKFKGIIDKIMYKEKNNETYVSLIDYKTGTPKTNMTNLIYGIDMQLPIYAYLIKKSNLFLNPKIIGFYFEQIIHEPLSYTPKKTYKELKKDSLKLEGYSIDDSYLVNMFDSSYENSEMIRGMKVSSKGFYYYTKVLTEDAIDKLVSIVDDKIKEAFEEIKEANFIINPKVIEKDNIGCKYCKYQDLCFKTGNDFKYLDKKEDLSYLESGDENA